MRREKKKTFWSEIWLWWIFSVPRTFFYYHVKKMIWIWYLPFYKITVLFLILLDIFFSMHVSFFPNAKKPQGSLRYQGKFRGGKNWQILYLYFVLLKIQRQLRNIYVRIFFESCFLSKIKIWIFNQSSNHLA